MPSLKLKRLLLRYHPPGIGLECVPAEESSLSPGAEPDVIHRDLPPTHDVHSVAQIQKLVEDLVKAEELLSKKHEKSLLQLLGRLYQIDTDPPSNAPKKTFPEGAKVICFGFNGSNACYNGNLGIITKVLEEKKTKYEVTFDNNTVVKLKENHILHVLNDGLPYRPGVLPVGCRVVIAGLRNHGALNGTVGLIVEFAEASQRYEIRAIDTGQLFRVKPDNILPALEAHEEIPETLAIRLKEPEPIVAEKPKLSIAPGAIVQLANLRNAGWLNAQTAEVLSVDQQKRRYEIRLSTDNSIKKVKAENVVLMKGDGTTNNELLEGAADEIPKGARVELCNLKTAAALNGERAIVLSKDRDSDRYEIRMEMDGSTKQARRDNFRVISTPML